MLESSPSYNTSSEDATKPQTADITIIGGGIAGLWSLARLRQAGYQAILLEANSLACGQTGASQGIIHGGTKYALTGKLTHSAQSIGAMPQRWQACLDGQGELDLTQAKLLSKHQYLWSNQSLAAKLTGFFASKVMSSRMQRLGKGDHIPPFNQSNFKGELYQLDESVLDIQSVAETLRVQFSEAIFQTEVSNIVPSKDAGKDTRYQIQLANKSMLQTQCLVLTAGAGNEQLLNVLALEQPKMQRRPLLMPMLKAKASVLPRLYAHCLGVSALPKMTITSHTLSTSGEPYIIWYLGGEIAEQGVGRSIIEQVQCAKKELQMVMPWMDFSSCQWSALAIDRAEPKMSDGSRPVEPAVYQDHQVITAWPVKLAMTPIMADKIYHQVEALGIAKNKPIKRVKVTLETTKTSLLPWEKVTQWIT